ncbi:hypothetical protein KQI42_16625 [Tissierella sp. MSJ-40]|uniref:Uncharacterized protein n=1 Tax=Tissierella simiarum TaxID=2841534 RepID=A0ABS6EAT0_9FIRM|nr:hypothetical protein [Tissierella simiarum]MBU5439641.1 hypothetical protein [Tissierella simiarum]
MKVSNLVVKGENIRDIIDILYNYRNEYYYNKPHVYSSENIAVLMRESFYARTWSTLMSVIILKFTDYNEAEIEVVISGGKGGTLLHDWGAENRENIKIVHEIVNACEGNSWELISIQPEILKESLTKSTTNKFKNRILNSLKKWM